MAAGDSRIGEPEPPSEATGLISNAATLKKPPSSSVGAAVDSASGGLWSLWRMRHDNTPMTAAMQAAWLVEDAMRGVPPKERSVYMPVWQRAAYLIYQELDMVYNGTIVVLMVLTFLETPLWCLKTGGTAKEPFAYHDAHTTCPAPDGGFIYLGQTPYIPAGWGIVIELLCYAIWLLCSLLVWQYNDKKVTGKSIEIRLWQVRLGATVVAIVDSIIFLSVIYGTGGEVGNMPTFRLAPYLRFVHLVTLDSVFRMLVLIPPVIPPFASIFIIYLGMYVGVSWVFCLLLDDMDMPIGRCAAQLAAQQSQQAQQAQQETPVPQETAPATALDLTPALIRAGARLLQAAADPAAAAADPAQQAAAQQAGGEEGEGLDDCDAVNSGFDSFGAALRSMMVAATNAAVPDQQIPMYTEVRAFAFLWAGVYFCINFVMLSLILAVVYNSYAESLKDYVLSSFRNRAKGLKDAFHVMRAANLRQNPESSGVSGTQIAQLLEELNRCHGSAIPYVPASAVKYLLVTLDDDGSGEISLREFFDFLEVIQYSFMRVRKTSLIERRAPQSYAKMGLARLKSFVELAPENGWGLQRIMWCFLAFNGVIVMIESWEDYANVEGKVACCTAETWAWVDFSFAMVYALNISLTLLVVPWERYMLSFANRFDLSVTFLTGACAVLWLSPVPLPAEVLRYFNLLRLLQLLKLLSHSKQMSFIADTFLRLLVGAVPIATLLFACTSLWALIGCQSLGGYFYGGNPALQDSELFEANYDVLNFNDFASSLMLFFVMLVTGGPFSELIDAVGTTWGDFWSSFFFMSYMYFIFFIIFNCFVSFIIDAFIARYELHKSDGLDKEAEEELAELATINDPDYDIVAQVREKGSEELYKRMFADELEEMMAEFEEEADQDEANFVSKTLANIKTAKSAVTTAKTVMAAKSAVTTAKTAVTAKGAVTIAKTAVTTGVAAVTRESAVRSGADSDVKTYRVRTNPKPPLLPKLPTTPGGTPINAAAIAD